MRKAKMDAKEMPALISDAFIFMSGKSAVEDGEVVALLVIRSHFASLIYKLLAHVYWENPL